MTTALTIIQLKTTIITDDDNGAVFLSVLLSSVSRIISFLDQFTKITLQLKCGASTGVYTDTNLGDGSGDMLTLEHFPLVE